MAKVLPSKQKRSVVGSVLDAVTEKPKTTHIITTLDGEIHYRVEASSIDEAIEIMAGSFGYPSYTEMCLDLNYTGQEFTVSRVLTQKQAEPEDRQSVKESHIKKAAKVALEAFKLSRRS